VKTKLKTGAAKPVRRSDGRVFKTAKAAARASGITGTAIHHILYGKTLHSHTHCWGFEFDDEEDRRTAAAIRESNMRIIRNRPKRVVRNDGAVFMSMAEAARQSGMSASRVKRLARKEVKADPDTWTFRFVSDAEAANADGHHKIRSRKLIGDNRRILRSDGFVFINAREAAKYSDVSAKQIRDACSGMWNPPSRWTYRYLKTESTEQPICPRPDVRVDGVIKQAKQEDEDDPLRELAVDILELYELKIIEHPLFRNLAITAKRCLQGATT
jgi:hypothetical protein